MPLQAGDVIVAGSDGLWDNMFDAEILERLPLSAGAAQVGGCVGLGAVLGSWVRCSNLSFSIAPLHHPLPPIKPQSNPTNPQPTHQTPPQPVCRRVHRRPRARARQRPGVPLALRPGGADAGVSEDDMMERGEGGAGPLGAEAAGQDDESTLTHHHHRPSPQV